MLEKISFSKLGVLSREGYLNTIVSNVNDHVVRMRRLLGWRGSGDGVCGLVRTKYEKRNQ
jgi:hypothetical protein